MEKEPFFAKNIEMKKYQKQELLETDQTVFF